MSPRDWQHRIRDILFCAKNIIQFTQDLSFDEFILDTKTIRAIAFELTTMGEAAKSIPLDIQANHKEIPWMKIQGIRNTLVHEYFRIDEEILWKTVKEDIPLLINDLEILITQD